MTAQKPNIQPANYGNLSAAISYAIRKTLQREVDDMLPARVIAYDRATNRATVQPMIYIVTTGDERIDRPQIASVPVLQLGGGGFVISCPVSAGDIGWIKANDADISAFKQSLKDSIPNTGRQKSFSDAIFIPDTMMRGVSIAGEDEENLTIQTLDGSVRISLFPDQVKITADKIVFDSPLTECTGAFISGTNSAYAQTATFKGSVHADGDVTAKGNTATTISLHSHTHSGVQTGTGNTGEPNP